MKYELLNHLVCPETGESLKLEVSREKFGQVEEGMLIGPERKHSYPITNYVPRFVRQDEYARTFSKQRLYVRRHFKHYQRDPNARALFYESTCFSKEQLSRGLALEVGCGYGRFIDILQKDGGEIVGVDLSTHSIELAQSFAGLRPRVHLVQCDLFKLPFRKQTFSSIYSLGVLHHTPNCKNAFQALSPYLAANGQMSIWVYHPHNQSDVVKLRRLTTKCPASVLYHYCILNQVFFSWIRRIPVIRWKFNKLVPGSVPKSGQHFWLRVMEDFDNLSPQYASAHSQNEVVEWFKEVGLSDIKVLDRLTAVTGFRR